MLGLSVPAVRDLQDQERIQTQLLPAGMLSWLLGAAWGPMVFGGRLDVGLGAVRDKSERAERGMGYLLGLGPVFRATLYEGTFGAALLAETSLMHLGTAVEEGCWEPCGEDDVKMYPQIGLQSLVPGAALQFTMPRKHMLIELRYQRPYWFRYADETIAQRMRAWDFMPSDQWTVSFGGSFGGR